MDGSLFLHTGRSFLFTLETLALSDDKVLDGRAILRVLLESYSYDLC